MATPTVPGILANPPAHVDVRVENDVVHIRLSVVVARWLKITMRCVGVLFLIGLIGFIAAGTAAERGSPTNLQIALLVMVGVIGLIVAILLGTYFGLSLLATEVVYDGRERRLRLRDQTS